VTPARDMEGEGGGGSQRFPDAREVAFLIRRKWRWVVHVPGGEQFSVPDAATHALDKAYNLGRADF